MSQNLPLISFVICTFNSEITLSNCLKSIQKLNYPKALIEVIIVDGGSSDRTLEIVKGYNDCRIIRENSGRSETATAIGYNQAKGDFIVNFPSDNVILDTEWLKKMLEPLLKYQDVVASETLHYTHVRQDKILNRYFALFGVNDPLAFYLDKRDRASYLEKNWHLNIPANDKGHYYLVDFNENNLPTMGANGFVVRKKFAKLMAKEPNKFFHIDSCLDLVNLGYNKFAFVKNNVWHKTGENFISFIKKRVKYINLLYFQSIKIRRYHLFNFKRNKLKLAKYIIFSLTFIEPLFLSIKGYFKIKDKAWFLHPFICFLTTCIYAYSLITYKLHSKK